MGISIFMRGDTTPNRTAIQSAGWSFRAPSSFVKKEFYSSIEVIHLLPRFTQALVTQNAVCNRQHSLDQRLCHWLLLSMDRLTGPDSVMTHELIANMLGVRREGITTAAGNLQTAGLIAMCAGISVLNRPDLEA